jgi:hypothetical protein
MGGIVPCPRCALRLITVRTSSDSSLQTRSRLPRLRAGQFGVSSRGAVRDIPFLRGQGRSMRDDRGPAARPNAQQDLRTLLNRRKSFLGTEAAQTLRRRFLQHYPAVERPPVIVDAHPRPARRLDQGGEESFPHDTGVKGCTLARPTVVRPGECACYLLQAGVTPGPGSTSLHSIRCPQGP